MSVIPKLATLLGQRSDVPNQQLAQQIADKNDKKAVQELVENLANKTKSIQSDCIKTLYEIGERKPALLARYAKEFLALLRSKTNRLVWGAMTALDAITMENPKEMYAALPKIIAAADNGSVITRDHAVGVLIKLTRIERYSDKAFALLIELLKKAPTNQLPMYAENALPIIDQRNKALFVKTLSSRLDEVETESKRRRIEKVVKKVQANLVPEETSGLRKVCSAKERVEGVGFRSAIPYIEPHQ